MRLLTIGHGTLPEEEFIHMLDGAGVRQLVDVRSFPGSRRNPQFGSSEMERWLPGAGLSYVWLAGLGGRRRPVEGSTHRALRHKAFRAYADHMETTEFHAALDELLALADRDPTAVMCSESLWWRCHRRLLADHLVLVRDVEVVHLMHDGRMTPHPPTDGVRRGGRGVVYDVGAPTELPGLEASS
jgi:uncharacterized protein (DUF488 family)